MLVIKQGESEGYAKAVYSDLSIAEKAVKIYNKKHKRHNSKAYIIEIEESKE
jgi:hypothetical protein